VDRALRIAAARRFAPPLVQIGAVDRRGARLRTLNGKAIGYALRSGLPFDDVYPGGIATARRLAPPGGTAEASAFVRASGLPYDVVYPPTFAGEGPRRRFPWGWTVVGLLFGACAGGPVGLAVGGVAGLLAGRA
jgi:hypothetical protein